MRISTWLGAGIALLLGNTASSQQLKLGKNPYTVQKSAVLELNSDNQGLLLVRLSDTIAINTLTPPDGMVIFFTPTKQLMVRSNGSWQPLTGGAIINNLNGLTASTQTFATGTTGTDFNISSSGAIHTFNLPDASATARGVVTINAQTIAGAKTFSSAPLFSSLTAGSIPFIGTGGLLSQNNANLFWDATNNRLGVGTASPTAALHLRAGTATASTGAPLKFTSGTNLTTAEDGAVEYDGTNYFASVGSTRYTLAKTLTATANLNFPSTASGFSSTLTVTVNGAADGDVVALGVPNSVASTGGVCYTAYVSAANTVTVKMNNYNPLLSLAIDPPAATFRVSVIKY